MGTGVIVPETSSVRKQGRDELNEGNEQCSEGYNVGVRVEEDGNFGTMKMESSEILEDYERALPYLEDGENDEDRDLASVRKTWEVSLFLVALPC